MQDIDIKFGPDRNFNPRSIQGGLNGQVSSQQILTRNETVVYLVLDTQECFDTRKKRLETLSEVSYVFLSVSKHSLVSKTKYTTVSFLVKICCEETWPFKPPWIERGLKFLSGPNVIFMSCT